MRPGLALAGCPLRLPLLSPSVSHASCAFLQCMPSLSTPAELQSALVTPFLCNIGLPRVSVRSASTTSFSRPHRAFTCVMACIFAGPPSGPFHRRLRRIHFLLRRFDYYWASDPSQAGLSPAETHTHSWRTETLQTIENLLIPNHTFPPCGPSARSTSPRRPSSKYNQQYRPSPQARSKDAKSPFRSGRHSP